MENSNEILSRIVPFQFKLLSFFGFIPVKSHICLPACWQSFSANSWLFALFISIGGMLQFLLEVSRITYTMSHYTPSNRMISDALYYAPYSAIYARGSLVLLLLLTNRSSWNNLNSSLVKLIFPPTVQLSERNKLIRRWKRMSYVLGLLAIVLHLSYELSQVIPFLTEITDQNQPYPNFPLRAPVWLYVTLWLSFESTCFVLSQQVFLVIVILTCAMWDLIGRCISLRISQENENQKMSESTNSFENMISDTMEMHFHLLMVCENVNGFFGWILVAIYGLDVVAMLCYLTRITAEIDGDIYVVENVLGLVLCTLYTTVCYIPFALLQQESTRITFSLSQLLVSGSASLISEQVKDGTPQSDLQIFRYLANSRTAAVNGAGLIKFTRASVIRAVTMALSFSLLIYEVLD